LAVVVSRRTNGWVEHRIVELKLMCWSLIHGDLVVDSNEPATEHLGQ
jgi:hypothetical protein